MTEIRVPQTTRERADFRGKQSSEFRNLIREKPGNKNLGQIVIILVLVTIVGLTIGLSLVSRSITDVRISSQIEQSNRAFSAAEAGVESAMKSYQLVVTPGVINLQGASARYNISAIGGNASVYNFPSIVNNGDSVVLWLVSHNTDGTVSETLNYQPAWPLSVCWKTGQTTTPAVKLTLYYKKGTAYKISSGVYDPVPSNPVPPGVRSPVNNFKSADYDINSGFCSGGYGFKATFTMTDAASFGIDPASIPLALRISPLYDNTWIGVLPDTGRSLPAQGKAVSSVGQTSTGVIRKIVVNQSYEALPLMMDFTIFSAN